MKGAASALAGLRLAESDQPALRRCLSSPVPSCDGDLHRGRGTPRVIWPACHPPMSVSAEEIRAATKDPSSPLSAGDEMPSATGENSRRSGSQPE